MDADATRTGDVPAEELRFNFRSGRLSLALVATVGERWRGNYERLRSPADLTRWYRECGLLDEPVAVTPAGLHAARTLREAIYRVARAVMAGRPAAAEDEAAITAAAAVPALVPVLHEGTGRLTLPGGGGEQAALSTVARDAIDLFTGTAADRIRECASPECALLFVDTSRPGRRRWCSSTACGSKDRSAAYRRRQRTGHDR
ncbi:CGNR zinc finger domain-containing protein [Actinomadura violacea]|uniref:ABATE domain-containing protein n=1 Tax=Actinomadura violacea TaxID=2819934 RepID=A0ABS3RND2_9ACTN|nr:ABATE domain-containing protein [Actinomadura violacea]MBO2458264.1 ABATE domain-containing protein [Actinomadura violacea]